MTVLSSESHPAPVSRRFLKSIAATFLTFTLALPALAQNTIHVPTDQPTIQAAINAAQNGDTVLVSPGTYNENIDFKGKSIIVTSGAKAFSDSSVASTIINGSVDGPVVNIATNEPVATTLNGFTIQNGHASVSSGLAAGGIFISNASPQITNNIITNNLGCGIHVVNLASPLIQGNDIKQNTYPNTTVDILCNSVYGDAGSGTGLALDQAGSVQIIGNTIEDNVLDETQTSGPPCGAGVNIYLGTQVLLRNNTIRNNHAVCQPGIAEFSPAKNLILIQNLIYGNISDIGSFPIQLTLSGTNAAPYPSITEINNTIYGSGQELLLTYSPSVIDNNIFFSTSPPQLEEPAFAAGLSCIGTQTQSSPITISHNDIFNTGTLQSGSCPLGPGNLAVDPQFLNLSTGDFHTQPTSPVVAAGDINALQIPSADLDGKARTVCGTIDLGVYEIRPHPPITLTGSPQTAPGQSNVTFTATVTGNCNMPTGVVTFLDGATILGTATLNASGVATFDTSFLFVGTHPITATYPGDFNFENSTSNTITEVITGPPTTTVLNTVSPNPARPLQPITVTATVSSAFTTPMGNVSFMANGAALTTVPLTSAGTALATVTSLHAGTYNITAVYGGSTEYAASTSNTIIETVLGTDTTATLAASPNPALPGQSITLTATISGSQTGIPLTGTVTFKDGATLLGATAVGANGAAVFSTSTLLTGNHPITATYSGSADYNASASNLVNEVVTTIPTSLGLNISPNPATVGQSVTMTATAVSTLPNQPPTGTVTFSDQSGTLGTASLVAGVAAFTTTTLTAGTHQITATLNPAGSFAPSSSATVSEVITAFDFALTASTTSLTIPGNDFQVITVTVTPSGGFPRAVNLTCSQVPLYAECVFAQSTTRPLSSGSQTIKLTVSTSSVFRYGHQIGSLAPVSKPHGRNTVVLAGLWAPIFLLGGVAGKVPRRLGHLPRLLLLLAFAALGASLQGCSGQLPFGTPAGDYVLTVTAADTGSATTHSMNLNLHVSQ